MAFCKNCGTQLKENQAFCSNCGAKQTRQPEQTQSEQKPDPITQSTPTGATATTPTETSTTLSKTEAAVNTQTAVPTNLEQPGEAQITQPTIPKKPLSFKNKIALFSGLIVILFIGGLHFYFSSQAKPTKVVEAFTQAIQQKDSEKLADLINEGQTKDQISEDEAAAFLTYLLKENDAGEIVEKLNKQADQIKKIKEIKPIIDTYGNKLVTLQQGKKKWGLYNQFYLQFYPIQLNVSSNLGGTDLLLNGKKLKHLKNSDTFENVGYVFPGKQEIKGIYNGDYTKMTKSGELDFSLSSKNKLDVSFNFDGQYVIVYSNYDDAVLYVNGKNTGVLVADIDELGPIETDGSLTVFAERKQDGKTVKSNKVKIVDESNVWLLFEEEEEKVETAVKTSDSVSNEEIEQFMETYFYTSVSAINSRDFSISEPFLDPKGKSYKESKNYISYIEENGITENFQGMEIKEVKKTKEGYQVKTEEGYNIYYGDGSAKYKEFQSQFLLTQHEDGLKVHTLQKTEEIKSEDL
ncbi:zinc ribbon domain-containing protein [Bacillus massilinigeriensis]|uniref:zinc ribbon domain-containing protein n=1 Tax=Bacillus massilionigeriensis TaxID=1805475 RepID=UPI0013562EC9|nr:zinc-ribbon domain-containing protein [Bacillus massilionigeriensis]